MLPISAAQDAGRTGGSRRATGWPWRVMRMPSAGSWSRSARHRWRKSLTEISCIQADCTTNVQNRGDCLQHRTFRQRRIVSKLTITRPGLFGFAEAHRSGNRTRLHTNDLPREPMATVRGRKTLISMPSCPASFRKLSPGLLQLDFDAPVQRVNILGLSFIKGLALAHACQFKAVRREVEIP